MLMSRDQGPRYFNGEEIMAAVSWADAVDSLEQALRDGLDPGESLPRTAVGVDHGQLLLMPGQTPEGVGVKVSSVAPENPDRGLPRIQGLYLLLDPVSLEIAVLMDGTALTLLRTAAVSALAVGHLAVHDAAHLVVFGTGPQAWAHIEAVRAVRPITSVTVIGRNSGRAEDLVERVRAVGLVAQAGVAQDVGRADVVVCATSSPTPLFDGSLLAGHACVVAIGSHDPEARELDDTVMRRAAEHGRIVVESHDSALRECGDVVMAIDNGALDAERLIDLGQLIGRESTVAREPAAGLRVFKSSGMGWEDLVVAQAVLRRSSGSQP